MAHSWLERMPGRVADADSVIRFVDTFGFCTTGPIAGVDIPNLADALNTSAFHVWDHAWGWKDDLHFDRRLYYAHVVRGQPTFISAEYLPDFIAALGGRGLEAERNPELLYQAGRISRDAFVLYQYLAEHPAQPSRELRARAGVRHSGPSAERAFVELQRRFVICKIDLTGRTRGTYSYIWDLAERFWPDVFEEARGTAVASARSRIRACLEQCGVACSAGLESKLFLWS